MSAQPSARPRNWIRRIGRITVWARVNPPVNGDGITLRTLDLLGAPGRPTFTVVTLAPHAEIGRRGSRLPGTWKRLLTNWWRYSGLDGTSYCPDRPNLRNAIHLVLPCLQLSFGWTTKRQSAVIRAHSDQQCAACQEQQRRLWAQYRQQQAT